MKRKTIRIQYSVIQFFLNPYMDKGVENPEERDWLFCNVFFIIISLLSRLEIIGPEKARI